MSIIYDCEMMKMGIQMWSHKLTRQPKRRLFNKVMPVFWDNKSVILALFTKRLTIMDIITGNCYKSNRIVSRKRHALLSKSVLLLADNAPAQSAKTVSHICAKKYETLYSPNLILSDYFLF